MAGSLVSLTPMQRVSPIDKNMFKNNSSAAKLDVVVGPNSNRGSSQRQNSLSKIAKFEPTQLKNFSSNISKNINRNKQASEVKSAEQSLVRKKIQTIRAQNPFANKSFAEGKNGAKVNIST